MLAAVSQSNTDLTLFLDPAKRDKASDKHFKAGLISKVALDVRQRRLKHRKTPLAPLYVYIQHAYISIAKLDWKKGGGG